MSIDRPNEPTENELAAMRALLCRSNMAIYHFQSGDVSSKELVKAFAARFGLLDLDLHLCSDDTGITSLQYDPNGKRKLYIPYSQRGINWHTDGYYNAREHWIHGMLLHCVHSAAEGGENFLMDHELAYIALRDENPKWIRALMADDAMTIPANENEENSAGQDRQGPVFSINADGSLHMRYTARKRNIIWKADPDLSEAIDFLQDLFGNENAPIYRLRLEAGQGLICNNVLHGRTAFEDDNKAVRLMYRGRFFNRINCPDRSDHALA